MRIATDLFFCDISANLKHPNRDPCAYLVTRPRSGKAMGGGELAGGCEDASDISWKEEIGNCISPLSNSANPKEMC